MYGLIESDETDEALRFARAKRIADIGRESVGAMK